MDALLRRRFMISAGGGSPTPPAVMIPYVRNSGGAYVDTGITPDNTTRVIVWARNFNANVGYLFGSRVASNDNMFGVLANTQTQSGAISFVYKSSIANPNIDCFDILSDYHKYELNNNSLYVDDNLIGSVTSSTLTNGYNVHLFGINTGGNHQANSYPIDICKAEIWKGGTLVRRYTPVESPVVGFYDEVSETVFINANESGTFAYGTFDKNAYERLQYIEATGAQYFDAGIHGTQGLPFVIKFMPNVDPGYPALFGARTSSSSKRYELSLADNTTAAKTLTSAYNTGAKYYGNQSTMNGAIWVVVKGSNVVTVYKKNNSYPLTDKGPITHTAANFETDYNIYVSALNNAGSAPSKFKGRFYYLGFGDRRNLVPAKINDEPGMFDTYNDVFYTSVTDTPFVAGTTV